MSLHDDESLLAAVAAALGETIALVRHRGFHIDSRLGGSERQLAGSRFRPATDDGDDTLDLAAYADGRESRPTGTVPEGVVPSRAHLRIAAAGLEPATPGL